LFFGLAGGVLGSEIFAEFLEIEIWAVGVQTREREKERNLIVLCVEGSSTTSSARILFSDYFFRRVKMVQQQATFAAGCFWSVELAFQRVPGVIKVKKFISRKNTKIPPLCT
jgi:hypothetical protein